VVSQRIRTLVRISGIVQGVGFRPFVYSVASGLGLGGHVGNDVDGVFAEVEGEPEAVGKFMLALRRDAPPLASIDRITSTPLTPDGSTTFAIAPSLPGRPGGPATTLVSADAATCDDCLAELADASDRRFGYPFINWEQTGQLCEIDDVPPAC
jgi:hydrogenase maturation protein HypF